MDCTSGIFCLADQSMQQRPINQLDVSSTGKRRRFVSETARCHYKPTCCALCGHHAIEFAHDRDADFESLPLFALHEVFLGAFAQYQINSAVWPKTATE